MGFKDIFKELVKCSAIMHLPEPFKTLAIENIKINNNINKAYLDLKNVKGKIEADKLMIKFKNESFAGKEVNSDYIIRSINNALFIK